MVAAGCCELVKTSSVACGSVFVSKVDDGFLETGISLFGIIVTIVVWTNFDSGLEVDDIGPLALRFRLVVSSSLPPFPHIVLLVHRGCGFLESESVDAKRLAVRSDLPNATGLLL